MRQSQLPEQYAIIRLYANEYATYKVPSNTKLLFMKYPKNPNAIIARDINGYTHRINIAHVAIGLTVTPQSKRYMRYLREMPTTVAAQATTDAQFRELVAPILPQPIEKVKPNTEPEHVPPLATTREDTQILLDIRELLQKIVQALL